MPEASHSADVYSLGRDGQTIVEHVEAARTLSSRMKGLLGRERLAEGNGLLLAPCGSIHTFFMRFALDLIFLDEGLKVVRFCRCVQPYRVASGGPRALSVVEIQSGWLGADAIQAGDTLELRALV